LMVYSLVTMMALVPGGLDPYLLGVGTLEAVGLGAMLWTATREGIRAPAAASRLTQPTLLFAERALLVGGVGRYGGRGTHPCGGTCNHLGARDLASCNQGRPGIRTPGDLPSRAALSQTERAGAHGDHPDLRSPCPHRPPDGRVRCAPAARREPRQRVRRSRRRRVLSRLRSAEGGDGGPELHSGDEPPRPDDPAGRPRT